MAYYDTVTSEALFNEHASRAGAQSFDTLYKSDHFPGSVSRWDTAHLFASRVICTKPRRRLALFHDDFPRSARGVHDCIDRLVDGPAAGFRDQYEPQIVRQHQPESLGYTWVALARLLRATRVAGGDDGGDDSGDDGSDDGSDDSGDDGAGSRRQIRLTTQYEGYTSSTTMRVGSSSPAGSTSGGSTSASSAGRLGWVDQTSSALPEDLTVRLASCFIRCVINYAQPTNEAFPIHFRDERLTSIYGYAQYKWIKATDDGGLQVYNGRDYLQVATIEGKRVFQQFSREGMPTIPDKTLGQLVGQALVQQRHDSTKTINNNNHITILAVAHYIKFFHFSMANEFIEEYETKPLPLPTTHYLRVNSTIWFDLDAVEDRKQAVKHILAMLAWAGKQRNGDGVKASEGGDDDGDGDESMEG